MFPFSKLSDPKTSFAVVVGLGWLTATIPALIIVNLLQMVLPPEAFQAVEDALISGEMPFWIDAVSIVVFAPLVETLIMGLVFWLSRLVGLGVRGQIIVQVIFWAALHGAFAFAWAFGPAWIFFVLAIIWTGQREASTSKAFWAVFLVHALNNGLATTAIAAERFTG